jgi:hypothetical protein
MTPNVEIKQKVLSVPNKLDIIQKMDTQPYTTNQVSRITRIPVSTLNNIMANKNNILQQGGSREPNRKKFKTSKYEKIETILLEWFCQKWAKNIPVAGPVLQQKAEEIALKLNIDFKASNGWID